MILQFQRHANGGDVAALVLDNGFNTATGTLNQGAGIWARGARWNLYAMWYVYHRTSV
ncbi:hypothetical protein SAMN04487926_16412 [Paraburkholderia steynii]|uniref:Uncharacterized protein n=1 Tax=Paraburkholderia steynii TaxID=1245441 RepID=A0A7Z7FPM3_9BURK|nr:hypothetical protein SAMN04487926_16412 [Paraburkholderia steynii]